MSCRWKNLATRRRSTGGGCTCSALVALNSNSPANVRLADGPQRFAYLAPLGAHLRLLHRWDDFTSACRTLPSHGKAAQVSLENKHPRICHNRVKYGPGCCLCLVAVPCGIHNSQDGNALGILRCRFIRDDWDPNSAFMVRGWLVEVRTLQAQLVFKPTSWDDALFCRLEEQPPRESQTMRCEGWTSKKNIAQIASGRIKVNVISTDLGLVETMVKPCDKNRQRLSIRFQHQIRKRGVTTDMTGLTLPDRQRRIWNCSAINYFAHLAQKLEQDSQLLYFSETAAVRTRNIYLFLLAGTRTRPCRNL